MLTDLSIRNIVLVDRLDIHFDSGLTVFTGETGAGKSILLDSLGLVLGARAEVGLIRTGADNAEVTARFENNEQNCKFPPEIFAESGITPAREFILRRTMSRDGGARGWCNEKLVSAGFLRKLGGYLIEVQGQFSQHSLLEGSRHVEWLDEFAMIESENYTHIRKLWENACLEYKNALQSMEASRQNAEYWHHVLKEIDALSPVENEEKDLSARRSLLQNSGRILEALHATRDLGDTESPKLNQARTVLERVNESAEGRFTPALAALERAEIEIQEFSALMSQIAEEFNPDDSAKLEEIEDRLYAIRELARRNQHDPNKLPELRSALAEKLEQITSGSHSISMLEESMRQAENTLRQATQARTQKRQNAARLLDETINEELPSLRLEDAKFETQITPLEFEQWNNYGGERVRFLARTNIGGIPGPLHKVASGGELSRFLLAIKLAIAGAQSLVFDEVDSNIGGATASAIGQRLHRLAQERQVLAVTHSPQVAAYGQHHFRVEKHTADGRARTHLVYLDEEKRREEIAYMIAAEHITDDARAVAGRLLNAPARREP